MGDFNNSYSRSILMRLVLATLLVVLLASYSTLKINANYLADQLHGVGLLVNGIILGLFLLGMVQIVRLLLRYVGEERTLRQFHLALESGASQPAEALPQQRLICQRFNQIKQLHRRNLPIDHAALASLLVANEHTRLSLPKFIHNILILSGVFGTSVSLSIALVGASSLLDSSGIFGNMQMVIHGMSTALSTTIIAIVSYVFLGYFYLKLTDVQTRLISRIEELTALYLLPRYAHSEQSVIAEVGGLVRKLHEVVVSMHSSQQEYAEAGRQLHQVATILQQQVAPVSSQIELITALLQHGFRLSDAEVAQLRERRS